MQGVNSYDVPNLYLTRITSRHLQIITQKEVHHVLDVLNVILIYNYLWSGFSGGFLIAPKVPIHALKTTLCASQQ